MEYKQLQYFCFSLYLALMLILYYFVTNTFMFTYVIFEM